MHTSTICLTVLSAAATILASARPDTSYLARNLRALSDTPYKRQTTSIPSECTSTCDPVYSQVTDGCSVSTCCTESFEDSYYKCIVCVGENADNLTASDIADAQDEFDSLYVFCYNNGSPLQEITLPGQDPSRSLSTSATGATSHATSTSGSSVASKTTESPSSAVKPSSTATTPSSHGTATGNGRAASATPKTGGASLGVSQGESGIWALAAAIVGLVVI